MLLLTTATPLPLPAAMPVLRQLLPTLRRPRLLLRQLLSTLHRLMPPAMHTLLRAWLSSPV
jgi:hypothetical protein